MAVASSAAAASMAAQPCPEAIASVYTAACLDVVRPSRGVCSAAAALRSDATDSGTDVSTFRW